MTSEGADSHNESERGSRSRLVLAGVLSIGTKAAEVVLSLLVLVILGRMLGAQGFGIYAFALATVSIASIPTRLGLPQLVVRETATGQATGDWGPVVGIWRWSTAASLLLGVIVAAAGTAFIFLFGYQTDSLGVSLLIGLLLVPLLSLASLRTAILRGLRHVGVANLTGLVTQPTLLVILLLAFVLFSDDVLTSPQAMGLTVTSALFTFALATWIVRRKQPLEIRGVTPRYMAGRWLSAAWPMALTQGAHQINRYVDIIILGLVSTMVDAGIYRVAAQGAMLASLGMVAIGLVTAPHITRLHALNSQQALQELLRRSSQAGFVLSALVTIAFAIVGAPLLGALFGDEFQGAWLPLMILAAAHVLSSAIGPTGLILNMTGHERTVTRVVAAAALLNIVLNLAFIPLFGAVGAAAATGISLVFWKAWLWFTAHRILGIRCSFI